MKKIFDEIIDRIKKSASDFEAFSLPSFSAYNTERTENKAEGRILYDYTCKIGTNYEYIIVNNQSKDKCKSFDIKPDINIVTVKWIKNSVTIDTFSLSWEERV